jgi:hypothetical protein
MPGEVKAICAQFKPWRPLLLPICTDVRALTFKADAALLKPQQTNGKIVAYAAAGEPGSPIHLSNP